MASFHSVWMPRVIRPRPCGMPVVHSILPECGIRNTAVQAHKNIRENCRRSRTTSAIEVDLHICRKELLVFGTTLAGHGASTLAKFAQF